MHTELIAVTAASGALGRLVIERLRALVPADRLVAVVRDPRQDLGVAARRGDYDEPESLISAFDGAGRVLLISSPELDAARRVGQHRNAIEAAVKAGVQQLVYTSLLGAESDRPGATVAHHATEAAIRAAGVPYTMLRNPFYHDAFVHPGLRAAVEAGELTSGTAGRGLNTATRRDLAGAAAAVLTGDGHANTAYDLTGPLWTFPELADLLSVAYREQAPEGPMGYLHRLVAQGEMERQTGDLQRLLGRPAASLGETVREALTAAR
ncbi:NAD(P)H-binding protein [Dactylosporangium sp. CA-233914]|uniref:NAD(P)H-binding protein n=1 Tax=Dactylosporangium sp. CA-233914 TaxID=3239934 RepID=UPI003D92A73F